MNQTKPLTNTAKIDFAVGGQAVLEGVMMRSPNYNIVSVRAPDGKIKEKSEYYQNLTKRINWLSIPILRGVINMFEMMWIGTKALGFSSKIALNEDSETEGSFMENLSVVFSIIFALGMSLLLFKFLPLWITDFLSHSFNAINQNYLIYNLIDGLLKTTLFVGYIALLNLLPDVRRVFMYHGAEHKSIMTYEQGLDLTVANARNQTRFHPRCGTSFILIVFLFSIFIFTAVPRQDSFVINFLVRLAFLPIIAGISYEMLKLSAKLKDNFILKLISAPGLLMQKLTTLEPDDQMLEVALNSLKLALTAEQKQISNHESSKVL
ncbi:DUF1385 domain-containing protein [Candidatus Peregrinibacteria bacterium]|nr:DUF1385 domain-containing protein [Candidatus Peregrinibacteria bacterium]